MKREPFACLLDSRQAAEHIGRFLTGMDFTAFKSDVPTRPGLERRLHSIGEALSQLSRIDVPSTAAFSHHRELIGFRNVLVHGYSGSNVEEPWQASQHHLPQPLPAARARASLPTASKTP